MVTLFASEKQSMPVDWSTTSVVRFLDSPHSDDALAERNKTYIDLGPVVMDYETAGESFSGDIKLRGDTEVRIPENISPGLVKAHQLFADATYQILGEEKFEQAKISFGQRRSRVQKGGTQVATRPHIDGQYRTRSPNEEELVLVGLATNAMPPILLNGEIKPESLSDDGKLMSVRALYKRFTKEPVPTSRLIVTGPSMLHESGRAEHSDQNRLFWRWHVRI